MQPGDGTMITDVAIYLKGHNLDPCSISRVLGVQPSRSQKKGGFKTGSTQHRAKIGMWALIIESRSRPVLELVDELLQTIGTPQTRLDALEGVEDAHLDILFATDDEEKRTVEFTLTKEQIAKLEQLGVSVCVTVA
jgi:hypothetical protein